MIEPAGLAIAGLIAWIQAQITGDRHLLKVVNGHLAANRLVGCGEKRTAQIA